MKIYMHNRKEIAKHNKKHLLGMVQFRMAVNEYTDMVIIIILHLINYYFLPRSSRNNDFYNS